MFKFKSPANCCEGRNFSLSVTCPSMLCDGLDSVPLKVGRECHKSLRDFIPVPNFYA